MNGWSCSWLQKNSWCMYSMTGMTQLYTYWTHTHTQNECLWVVQHCLDAEAFFGPTTFEPPSKGFDSAPPHASDDPFFLVAQLNIQWWHVNSVLTSCLHFSGWMTAEWRCCSPVDFIPSKTIFILLCRMNQRPLFAVPCTAFLICLLGCIITWPCMAVSHTVFTQSISSVFQ